MQIFSVLIQLRGWSCSWKWSHLQDKIINCLMLQPSVHHVDTLMGFLLFVSPSRLEKNILTKQVYSYEVWLVSSGQNPQAFFPLCCRNYTREACWEETGWQVSPLRLPGREKRYVNPWPDAGGEKKRLSLRVSILKKTNQKQSRNVELSRHSVGKWCQAW